MLVVAAGPSPIASVQQFQNRGRTYAFLVGYYPGARIRFRNDAEWTPVLPDLKVGFEDNGIKVEQVHEDSGHTVFVLRWAPGDLAHIPEIGDTSSGWEDPLGR